MPEGHTTAWRRLTWLKKTGQETEIVLNIVKNENKILKQNLNNCKEENAFFLKILEMKGFNILITAASVIPQKMRHLQMNPED